MMDSHHHQQYHVAWILSSFDHHEIAASFFDQTFHRYTTTTIPQPITYTLGRVGPHHVVAASQAPNAASQGDAGHVADSLLQEFPSIRAGFLISADATVPRDGDVRVGDIVIGFGSDAHGGVVYYDYHETIKQKRLFITSQSRKLTGAVLAATNEIGCQNGRDIWRRHLQQSQPVGIPPPTAPPAGSTELNRTQSSDSEQFDGTQNAPAELSGNFQLQREPPSKRQPKALRGVIASSKQTLRDPAFTEIARASKDIFCFESAAATMRSRPFMVVSGIASCFGDAQEQLPSNEACRAAASYVTCLVNLIDPVRLAAEISIASRFEYDPFDLERPGFRLLRLEAGTGPNISCHLFQAYLDDDDLIPYEALSYNWGSNQLTDSVTVNGKIFAIPSNLYEGLPYLRQEFEDRILWIDAICIDQNNLRERGHQVGYMGSIYSRADQVLFWLGYVRYDLGVLIAAVKRFEKRVPFSSWKNWSYADPRWLVAWDEAQSNFPEDTDTSQQSRLELLMSNPWFRRAWILQEVAKAKKALVGCSQGWIHARSFTLLPRLLGVVPDAQCQAIIDIMPGPSRISSWWAQKPNLCTLLWRFRASEASDPRDRVYALLNLASDMNGKEIITPDYTKNEQAVVKEITGYLFSENSPAQSFAVKDIADLQNKLPNLSCMALERMIFFGRQAQDIQGFLKRQNTTVWLSEAAASYIWCVNTTRMDFFLAEPAFEQVVKGSVDETYTPKKSVALKSFVGGIKQKFEITQTTIQTSRRYGINIPALVVLQNRDDIQVTEALINEAVQQGPDTLELLFDRRGKDVYITESVIKTSRRHAISLPEWVVRPDRDDIRITEALVLEAIRMGPETLQPLFDRRGKEILITDDVITEAIQRGLDTLKFILGRLDRAYMTEAVILEAVRVRLDIFEFLLRTYGNGINMTEAIVLEAVRKGQDRIELLVSECGDRLAMTPKVLVEAARTSSASFRFLLDKYGGKIRITESVIVQAAKSGSERLEILLDRYGGKIKITEDVIVQAARTGSHELKILLERYGGEVKVTEPVLTAAAWSGVDTLKVLLDRHGEGIRITEAVVVEAARSGLNSLGLLLDRYKDDIKITEAVVIQAAKSGYHVLKLLIDKRGREAKITEDIVTEATKSGYYTLKLLMDRRYDVDMADAVLAKAEFSLFLTKP